MIRKIKKEDREIYLSMSKDFYHSDAVSHSIPEVNFIKTFEKMMSEDPFLAGYILQHNGQIAGYALLSFTYSNEAGGSVLWIEELYMKEAFRGYGLGSKFLRFIENEYLGSIVRMRLEVSESNSGAIRLYEKKGYRKVGYIGMHKKVYDKNPGDDN